MPCSWRSRYSGASNADAATSCASSPAADDWKRARKFNLRMMRKQVRTVVLLMALMEAMRVGPVQMVYAGRKGYAAPGKDDFGIAYTAGYIFSYIYVCIFSIIFVPLFSWWVPNTPSDPEKPSVMQKFAKCLQKFNMVLLPVAIALCLLQHIHYTFKVFIHVDSSRLTPTKVATARKNWLLRLFLLLGIAISTSFGYGAFQILEQMELAHVKTLEYAIIVVPMQVNIGILFGTIMQWKMEKRAAMREARAVESAKLERSVEIDEKAALLEV